MNERERLMKIIIETPCVAVSSRIAAEHMADHLLANGVTVQRWIPVTERLPEKDQYVWCYSNKYGGYFFVGYRGYRTGEWVENGFLHIGEVTHWMPLPQPPKEEK